MFKNSALLYTCLAQTFKRSEGEKMWTRCDGGELCQQQLDYWQQHMQHVSSWARAAIISDGQTNTWHWFDLSICTAAYRETTEAGLCKRNCAATGILCLIIKRVCSSQALISIIYHKTCETEGGGAWSCLPYAHADNFMHIELFELMSIVKTNSRFS